MNATDRRRDRRRHEKLLAEIAKLKSWNVQMTQKLEKYERAEAAEWWVKMRRVFG